MKIIWPMLLVLVITASTAVYLTTRHRTEAIFQRNALIRIDELPDSQIRSVYLRSRWDIPEKEVTLTWGKDDSDIKKLMAAIRDDLWVDRIEQNPNGNEPAPAYDVIWVKTTSGKSLELDCWMGIQGGANPSLTMRSKRGDFKRITQDILKRKGKLLTKKE